MKKVCKVFVGLVLVLLVVGLGGVRSHRAVAAEKGLSYRTHVQKIGWQDYVRDGGTSGTSGKSLRLEGIQIKNTTGVSGSILYKTHIQGSGWETAFKQDGSTSGTLGQSKRLEAIQIKLAGEMAKKYDIYYRVHAQQFGWLDWAKNGASAGTEGYSYRLEAIQITLVQKGKAAPGKTSTPFKKKVKPTVVSYQTHVQSYGWQPYVTNGQLSGTSGKSKRLEAIKIKVSSPDAGNVEYRTHIQKIGWETSFKKNGALSGTSGQSKRLEAIQIKLSGKISETYDIYYRVHAQQFGWLGWAKNGASAGTAGYSYRLEGIQIKLVKKGNPAPGTTTNAYKNKQAESLADYKKQAVSKVNGNYGYLTNAQKNSFISRINKATSKAAIDKIIKEVAAQNGVNKADLTAQKAQTKVEQAQTKATQANQAVTAKTTAFNKAKTALTAAQAKVDSAESNKVIVVGTAYVNALNAYNEANSSDANYQQLEQQLIAAGDAASERSGDYQGSATDKGVKINQMSDLTNERRITLTQYAARLINSIRREFGNEDWLITAGAIKFSKDVTTNYTNVNWDPNSKGHYVEGINQAAAGNGLNATAKVNMYEDLAGGRVSQLNPTKWNLTMADFKKMIFDAVKVMMFNGAEWGHANDLSGELIQNKDVYFGTSFSLFYAPDGFSGIPLKDLYAFSTHFVRVPKSFILEASRFDTATQYPVDLTSISQNELNQLKIDLANKQATFNTAKKALDQAKATAKTANSDLATAKNELAAAKKAQEAAYAALAQAQA